MNISALNQALGDLQIIHQSLWDGKICGISSWDRPVAGHLILIKEKALYQKLLQFLQQEGKGIPVPLGLIVDRSVLKSLSLTPENLQQVLGQYFKFIGLTENAALGLCQLSQIFYQKKYGTLNDFVDGRQMGTAQIHPSANIAQGVFIGEHVTIGPQVTLLPGVVVRPHCVVEAGTFIGPNVTLYPHVHIGSNCRLHSGVVVGADGFGYHFEGGQHHKIWHMGGVEIGDEVEVGANSTIDGGTFSPTCIGKGSKIDNLVQVGHNCQLGVGVILCGGVAIGGSTKIGDFSVFGGCAGSGHGLSLGKRCQVAGGALVNCDWPDDSKLGGHPARPLREWMRGLAFVRKNSLTS